MTKKIKSRPWILVLDIETRPIEAYVWGLFDVNIPLNMIKRDWGIISWSAKWYKDASGKVYGPHDKIMYKDLRKSSDVYNDRPLLTDVWLLLDSADIVIGQNSKRFDTKKLNSRFKKYKMGKPSDYRHFDTLIVSKRHFADTSFKLEYASNEFNTEFKKLKHEEFGGFSLWIACLAGDQKAWKAMEKYNCWDVFSTEEYARTLMTWDDSFNLDAFSDQLETTCTCGSSAFLKRGFNHSNTGRFQRFQCTKCKKWTSGKTNLLTKEKKQSLRDKS